MVSYNAWCMNRCLPDGVTTPVPGPTTPKTQADCCNQLKLTLHNDAATNVGYYYIRKVFIVLFFPFFS